MIIRMKLVALVATLLLVAGTKSEAGLITQVASYPATNSPFSAPLTFNKFDTSLGTLNAVTLILNENGTVTSQVYNFGAASSYVNASESGTVTVVGPDSSTISTSLSTTASSGSISAGSFTNVTQVTAGTVTGSAATSTNNVALANFGAYEGTAGTTFTVDAVASLSTTGTSPSGTVAFGGTANVGGSLEIVYSFTAPSTSAIPEPASFAMVVLGLGGVFAARRFRHRSA